MEKFKVSQNPKFTEARTYAAESGEKAAMKLAVLIPLADWEERDGRFRLRILVEDEAGRRVEHTFFATVVVPQ